ncbi:zinc cluster transcription factor [Salix suchowensis]|nr:zinc cluster transcription factor [Salix suchowensis]
MAGCKFFKPQLFDKCKRLANEFAVRAFAEQWKRVEVVQAFACLTYWKDPDDTACRMAIELGLNRYVARPPLNETDIQLLERRNRERTYLVLWVHDRSLSTQTGRQYMLQEDELVRHSETWHEEGGRVPRPEDVIVAAMVQLRRVASETTDMFYSSKGPGINHQDVNYDVVLHNCNGKLSFGLTHGRGKCTELLRSPNTVALLPDGAAEDSCALITRTANAYHEVSTLSQTSTLAAYHSRFLHSLVASSEISNSSRRMEKERSDNSIQIDPRLQGSTSSHSSVQLSPPQMHSHHPPNSADQPFHFPASPNIPAHPTQQNHFAVDGTMRCRHPSNTAANVHAGSNYFPGMVPQHASELDANYWKHMLLELGMGYGEHAEATGNANVDQDQRHMPGHPEQPHQQYQHAIHQGQGHQVSYQHLQTSQGYNH